MDYRIYEHEDGLEVVTPNGRFECLTYIEAQAYLKGYGCHAIESAAEGTEPLDPQTYLIESTGHHYPYD